MARVTTSVARNKRKKKTLKQDQMEKYNELRDKPVLQLTERKPNEKNPLGILNWFE